MCSQQAFISSAGEKTVLRHDSSFALAPEGPFRKRDIRSRRLAQEIGTVIYGLRS